MPHTMQSAAHSLLALAFCAALPACSSGPRVGKAGSAGNPEVLAVDEAAPARHLDDVHGSDASTPELAESFGRKAPNNFLRNPGFEDEDGWLSGWTVTESSGKLAPYIYCLSEGRGGHGTAVPRTGKRAVEVYTSDRRTTLAQSLELRRGQYRISVWARNNGSSLPTAINISLGSETRSHALVSDRYRRYYADFSVTQNQATTVSFSAQRGGIALDDALVALQSDVDETPAPLFADLVPSNEERAGGIQTYLAGHKQWVNLVFTSTDPGALTAPKARITVNEEIEITGINEELLDQWNRGGVPPLHTYEKKEAHGTRRVYEIAVPRFVEGPAHPIDFGGFWIEVPSATPQTLLLELVNGDAVVSQTDIKLVPLAPPSSSRRPQLLRTVFYGVQSWKMEGGEALANLPEQFALVGGNVWSDYTVVQDEDTFRDQKGDLVRERAAREYGVQDFWPNFSELLETSGSSNARNGIAAQRSVHTNPDGTRNPTRFSLHYAARGGRAWLTGWLAAIAATVRHPIVNHLAYRNTGFITDGLEFVTSSYDDDSLQEFARTIRQNPSGMRERLLRGEFPKAWPSYNMRLYSDVTRRLSARIKAAAPGAMSVNTAGSYGPAGVAELSLREQASSSTSFDYFMPQWYDASYNGAYVRVLQRGLAERAYDEGRHNRLIPLLSLSMGGEFIEPELLRFMVFDLVSYSKMVKGIGYYIGTNAFADGRMIASLSSMHTLLAELERYYMYGRKIADLASFEPRAPDTPELRARSLACPAPAPATAPSGPTTEVRTHVLGGTRDSVLFTVLTHGPDRGGQAGTLHLQLAGLGLDPTRYKLMDKLTGQELELSDELAIDTAQSGNLALLEALPR